MKKICTLLFSSLIILSSAYAQIPNPSFENWTSYTGGEYPTFWATSDSAYVAFGGGHSAVRELTDICDLINSVKLTSVSVLGNQGPGVATNGKITGISTITGGSPYTVRPLQFTGCYKYIPAASDSGRIFALLTRWNGTARDTIALAAYAPHLQSTMTNFSIPFVYLDLVNIPDTILIVLSSGQGVNQTTAGSVLTVDNVSTSGAVGLHENTLIKNINIFPQPAQDVLNIQVELNQNVSMLYEVADITGRKILSGKMNSTSERIDISTMSRGNYFIALRNEDGAILYTSKFIMTK